MDLLRTRRLHEKLSADPHIFYLDELSAKGTLRVMPKACDTLPPSEGPGLGMEKSVLCIKHDL